MVKYVGKITRKEVNELYGRSRAGIVIYQPAANHNESQPIKLFEFMAAGLPVIASDFPLWKTIVEENGCGICVDPENVHEVKDACKLLLEDTALGKEMGISGRNAVVQKYNWNCEKIQLLNLYKELINMKPVKQEIKV